MGQFGLSVYECAFTVFMYDCFCTCSLTAFRYPLFTRETASDWTHQGFLRLLLHSSFENSICVFGWRWQQLVAASNKDWPIYSYFISALFNHNVPLGLQFLFQGRLGQDRTCQGQKGDLKQNRALSKDKMSLSFVILGQICCRNPKLFSLNSFIYEILCLLHFVHIQ